MRKPFRHFASFGLGMLLLAFVAGGCATRQENVEFHNFLEGRWERYKKKKDEAKTVEEKMAAGERSLVDEI